MAQAQLTLIPNTLFDYATLDRETEVAAQSDAALIKGLMRRTAEDVIKIGKALIRQKAKLPHGMFLPWIETEFEMSERTARKMMSVADAYGKSAPNADLSMSALYELAAPSTPPEVSEEIERRVEAGELVNADVVRTLKAQYNEVAAKALDLAEIVRGEYHENAIREPFQPSEVFAIYETVGPLEIAAAKARMAAGGKAAKGGQIAQPSDIEKKDPVRARDKIGKFAGVSGRTLEKIIAVTTAARGATINLQSRLPRQRDTADAINRPGRYHTPAAAAQTRQRPPYRISSAIRR